MSAKAFKRPFKLNFRKRSDTRSMPNDEEGSLTFSPKDLPHLSKKDVVRVTSLEDRSLSIIVEACQKNDETVQRNTVCIVEDVVGSYFPFKRYSEVTIERVSPSEVALDLLELTFREQYVSRSDMCRIRRFLLNRCVHLGGKVEFCSMRLKVRELWRKGENVTSGYVDENTRVVFRSSSALIFIFIQMSVEMWDFDTQSVCYYEKCVDGFLPELFQRWRDFKCSHYVTVVLFSRWFYTDCESQQCFPVEEQQKIQKDYRGRYYQDFYQVLVQNEHYEDWNASALGKIRSAFFKYNKSVEDHMFEKGMPVGTNSTASDGNILEALNMTFNIFTNHRVDRTFERTGQVVVLITPGGGVFNVDRTFANMSKQINFDYGIAVDLVCLGEQPLHAVPLLIYHSKTTAKGKPPEIEDYFIMHWVNYSYYNPILYPNPLSADFHPRIKLPSGMLEGTENVLLSPPNVFPTSSSLSVYPDFDAYDNYVSATIAPKRRQHKTSVPQMSPNFRPSLGRQLSEDEGLGSVSLTGRNAIKIVDTPEQGDQIMLSALAKSSSSTDSYSLTPVSIDHPLLIENISGSCPIRIPKKTANTNNNGGGSYDSSEDERQNTSAGGSLKIEVTLANNNNNLVVRQQVLAGATAPTRGFYSPSFTSTGELGINDRLRVGSAEGRHQTKQAFNLIEPEEVRRPLINPFKPSEFSVRITSNRRRWIHVFPVDSRGLSKQSHHSVAGTSIFYASLEEPDPTQVPEAPLLAIDTETDSAEIFAMRQKSPEKLSTLKEACVNSTTVPNATCALKGKTLIWAWGCTGEEQWNPDIEIGTDWKSIVVPSCLPTTTDFFPDARSLKYDYLFSEYTILLDDTVRELWRTSTTYSFSFSSINQFSSTGSSASQISDKEDFRAHVFNELVAQRLQQGFQVVLLPLDMLNSAITVGCGPTLVPEKVCYLSISRIFHRVSLVGHCMYVTKFVPRHAYPLKTFSCLYEIQVPDSNCYQSTSTKFEHEAFEKVNWSSIDNLITLQGETEDYILQRDAKFWESRFFLLPSFHPATQKIYAEESPKCDIYADEISHSGKQDSLKLLDSFIKFMEILNRIRRAPNIVRLPSNNERQKFDPADLHLILQTVSSSKGGLNFIQSTCGSLSSISTTNQSSERLLFVSAEFVHWLIGHVIGIGSTASAISYAQQLLTENKIRHVSGVESRFVYGFFLYYFVNASAKYRDVDLITNSANVNYITTSGAGRNSVTLSNNSTFYEVAFTDKPCDQKTSSNFCHKRYKSYKYFFDPLKRSERQEWGHIKINQTYFPGAAFEINFQWLVATGAIVSEAVLQLHRKTTVYPLCLLPVPKDPFALPENPHSDPLRLPILIVLDEQAIISLTTAQIGQLRLAIVSRYGFVPMTCEIHKEQQFIHLSGGMSIMLRNRTGFLWSWNHTLSHRYRTPFTTGDEKFLDKMLADFRLFCRNADNRLCSLIQNLLNLNG